MKGFALDERQKIRLTCCSTCSSCEPYSSTLTTSLCRDQVEDEKAFPREDSDFINGEELVVKGEYIHVRILWLRVYSHDTKTKASSFQFRIGMKSISKEKSLSFSFTLGVNRRLILSTRKKNLDIIS